MAPTTHIIKDEDGSPFATGNVLDAGRLVVFEGVPYAEAPVGALRFSPPVQKNLGGGKPFDFLQRPPAAWELQGGIDTCV